MKSPELLSGPEATSRYSFARQTHCDLIFYRVAKLLGYPIQIRDTYGKNGQIKESIFTINESAEVELGSLWDQVWKKTRKGEFVRSACLGAPHSLLDEITKNQPDKEIDDDNYEEYNSSPKVPLRAVQECFMLAYERVDGYHSVGNGGPKLDNPYRSLQKKHVASIDPEAMGILLYQAIQEVSGSK